jgi:hypothetical protein
MGWRGTVALAVALVVAAAYAYVDLASQDGELTLESIFEPSSPTPPGRGVRPVLVFEPGDVVAVVVRRGDQETRIARSGAAWAGVTPPDAVDEFLANLAGLSQILTLEVPAGELADHGLDPPRSTVTLERRGAAPLSLRVGGHNPPATGVYVQIDGRSEVILTGALLLWEVDKIAKAARGPQATVGD